MKIILENEKEVKLWDIMMAAHYKWEKNHGDSLRDRMEWYFFDLHKEETDEIIQKVADVRLEESYGKGGYNVIDATEEQNVRQGLEGNCLKELSMDKIEELKSDLVQEYKDLKDEYEGEKSYLPDEIKNEITSFYYTFFNAPENLTVEYNGEIIQKQK